MRLSTANKEIDVESMKRENLALLPWLSLEQALVWLKENFKVHMTDHDLLSHCIESHCSIYIKGSGVEGVYPDGMSHVFSGEVYGIGWQKLLNPENLKGCYGKFLAELSGDVLTAPDPYAEKISRIEWKAEIDLIRNPPQFKKIDIDKLARKINQVTGTITEKSLLLAIGALQKLLLDTNLEAPKNQSAIINEILSRHEKSRGLGLRTLEKIFSSANAEFNKKLHRKSK